MTQACLSVRSPQGPSLNRLKTVAGIPWGIDYAYDRFGNRLSATGSASTPNFQSIALEVDPATNRITSQGWEYDDVGNVIEDGGAHHLVWDSADRLVEMGPPQPSTSGPPGDDGRCTTPPCPSPPPPPQDPPPPLDDGRSSLPPGLKAQSAGTMLYEYDYQDRRLVKDDGGTGRIYFWDEVIGEVVWGFPLEATGAQDVVRGFFNGRLVVENDTRPGAGLHYMHRDHLGTSKLMTDFFFLTVVCDEVYHPFGQLQSSQPSSCNAHVRKFTGKERDEESGMDYFGARYDDPVTGRFLSPDPIIGLIGWPQSHNRYAYAYNNPFQYRDSDGAFALPALPVLIVGGGLIGAGFGAVNAYLAGESIAKGAIAGAVGGAVGGATILFSPFASGAAAGFFGGGTAQFTGVRFDLVENKGFKAHLSSTVLSFIR